MKTHLHFLILLFLFHGAWAQKASDVLENGHPVKSGHSLFFKYDPITKLLNIQTSALPASGKFIPVKDSAIYLVREDAINVYLMPLNPLSYSTTGNLKVIDDPINAAAITALGNITDQLSSMNKNPTASASQSNKNEAKVKKNATQAPAVCAAFDTLVARFNKIKMALQTTDRKEDINTIFTGLKALNFLTADGTEKALESLKKERLTVVAYFDTIKKKITELQKKADDYQCDPPSPNPVIVKLVFNGAIKDLQTALNEQMKRLTALNTAFDLVQNAYDKAKEGAGPDLQWCIPLGAVSSDEGKIALYTLTINASGYDLNDKKEIVALESKEALKRTIRIRRFQRFVPEVSVGTAYTFFNYNSYGTTSDSTGQQRVASPTRNMVRNINIATMLNFNYYIRNSNVHPLYQIGLGLNSGMPTLLTGFGLRSNVGGMRRMAIAGGIAATWVKELDKLKVGDKVSGTDDIDKDLKFQFSWPPKFYLAIQYNF